MQFHASLLLDGKFAFFFLIKIKIKFILYFFRNEKWSLAILRSTHAVTLQQWDAVHAHEMSISGNIITHPMFCFLIN